MGILPIGSFARKLYLAKVYKKNYFNQWSAGTISIFTKHRTLSVEGLECQYWYNDILPIDSVARKLCLANVYKKKLFQPMASRDNQHFN